MPTHLPPADQTDTLPLIRASELAQYSFCQRAWWLNTVKQIPSSNQVALTRGVQTHRDHTRQVQSVVRWRQASFSLLGAGTLLLGIALLLYFLQ